MNRTIILALILLLTAGGCTEDPVQPTSGGPGILRTDELGNILSGDSTDWCFIDTSSFRSRFLPAYPNPSSGMINFRFHIPQSDTVSLYFASGIDTNFLYRREPLNAGTYTLSFNGAAYLGLYQRIYFESKYLTLSDSCKNYGDIKFEDPN